MASRSRRPRCRARETVSLGAQREADGRAAGRGGERVRVGIDCRKIGDFGIGTYIRGLLNAMTGIDYVAFGPRNIALPPRVEHIVVDAPKYSIRELFTVDLAPKIDLCHAHN